MTSRGNFRQKKKLSDLWNRNDDDLSNNSTDVYNTMESPEQHGIPDEQLVVASQHGDLQAFEILVVRYQRQIFNLIYQMTHNADVIEDIGQEVFMAAFKAMNTFQAKSSFFTWLYRIAINHCKNYLTASSRAQNAEKRYRKEHVAVELSDDDNKNPQHQLLAKEFVEQIEEAIGALPEEQRMVLTLCEFEGLSYQEIAEILDCPIGTIRSRLSRARTTLQEMLGEYM